MASQEIAGRGWVSCICSRSCLAVPTTVPEACYLSDGGHFDNLGIYELVRRRCRYIVAVDAEQDESFTFDALGAVIRKCESDFGIRIAIDVTPIRLQGEARRSRWHCAIGTIHYAGVDPTAVQGVLVYLKASLTGDEPTDVLTFAQEHPPFPHQTTLNQFFTESQFESYRTLGLHIAREVFRDAMARPEQSAGDLRRLPSARGRQALLQFASALVPAASATTGRWCAANSAFLGAVSCCQWIRVGANERADMAGLENVRPVPENSLATARRAARLCEPSLNDTSNQGVNLTCASHWTTANRDWK